MFEWKSQSDESRKDSRQEVMPAACLTVPLATVQEVTQVSLWSLLLLVLRFETSQSETLLVPHSCSLLSHECQPWVWTSYLWCRSKCESALEQMSELQECWTRLDHLTQTKAQHGLYLRSYLVILTLYQLFSAMDKLKEFQISVEGIVHFTWLLFVSGVVSK